MKAIHILIVAFCALLCSCSSIKHTSTSVPVSSTVASFTVADLDVQPTKIMSTTKWNYNPFVRVSVENVKTNTAAKMLRQADADVLLEPEYIIERRGFLRGGSVTVIGFPAKFKNFHTMTPEEAAILKEVNSCPKQEKHKKFLFF
ncbi:MAG: hypothetical protein NC338_08035 [Firmicutes bacterium]|nr:hypothetical protein [Bacillota bacterium]MCM1401968.1 hypothetical protein [Bacteroides sp.]MCM1477802.1 hypothetical protein [Bacteroides sp.]